jgi:hypothetical protein
MSRMSQRTVWVGYFVGCASHHLFHHLSGLSDSDDPRSCRRQISRYTCPSCNLSYCGLKCFRSEVCFPAHILPTPDESPQKSHSRCSETFYRKEIEIGIKSETSKPEGDRDKMVELLKRIEDQSASDEDGILHHSDEEHEEDNLAHRFSAIDICESPSACSTPNE